jgi:toxin ParE1/3/4
VNLRKADDFIADIERQYEWYLDHASTDIAERYLIAVETTCALLGSHPLIGTALQATHPRLSAWRFLAAFRPFQRHIVFYEMAGPDLILRRVMHGHRDLPRRLLDPPGAE